MSALSLPPPGTWAHITTPTPPPPPPRQEQCRQNAMDTRPISGSLTCIGEGRPTIHIQCYLSSVF